MNNSRAKKIKKELALKMYGEHAKDGKFEHDDRKAIYASGDFKPVYRARKRNYTRGLLGAAKVIKMTISKRQQRLAKAL